MAAFIPAPFPLGGSGQVGWQNQNELSVDDFDPKEGGSESPRVLCRAG